MRSSFLSASNPFIRWAATFCCLTLAAAPLFGQATWNFSANTTAPASLPLNVTGGNITAGNLAGGALAIETTSASSGYTGASGGNNIGLRAVVGPLAPATSTYIEFTLSPTPGLSFTATGLTLGTRSTSTGPAKLTVYSSANNFASPLSTATVNTESTSWALVNFPAFQATGPTSGPLTIRIYGSDGSGSPTSSNWRVDDVRLSASLVAISTQPASQSATVGDTVTFSVTATGSGTVSYQWRKDGTAISGNTSATTNTLVLPKITSASEGSYTVVVTDVTGSATSAAATLTVNKAPATVTFTGVSVPYTGAPQQPSVATTPAGRNVTFTFQPGPGAPTAPGSYAVVATINDPDYVGSAAGTFTIGKAAASVSLGNLAQAYDGNPRPVTFTTTPPDLRVNITYEGSTTAPTGIGNYAVIAAIDDPLYYGTATGTLAILPIAQVITFPALADRVSTDAPFALAATASSGLPVTFSLLSGSPDVATLAGSILTLTGRTGSVMVRATQEGGGNFAPAAPVDRVFQVVERLTPPVITASPNAYTGNIGDRVTLTGAAIGSPAPSYQWLRNSIAIAGATDATFTIASATEEDSALYMLTATNSVGVATTIPVAVTIGRKPQTVTLSGPSGPLPAGSGVRLSAYATSGLPVTLTLVSGAASLTANELNGTGGTVVVRASQAGNDVFAPAPTVERTFTFIPNGITPFLTIAPSDQAVPAGTSASFRAVAIGTPAPTYQWHKDGVAIEGATNGTLALPPVGLADAGRYSVVAANPVGTATAAATLTVRAAPVILTPPADQAVAAGTPVTFTVSATGFPAVTYQWRRNQVAIEGATGTALTIAGPRNSDEGQYDVVVSNELGSVTSAGANLQVEMKDVTGMYFGRFVGTSGAFVLVVRDDGTAAFVGHLAGLQTGIASEQVRVDFGGNFTAETSTLAGVPSPELSPLSGFAAQPRAAAPRAVTLRGTLDEASGALAGTIPELGITLEGARVGRTGRAAAQSGFYRAALIGSADGRGYIVVAPDGQAFVFTAASAGLDSASGPLADNGRLRLTTSRQAVLDLGFNGGFVTGTVRVGAGAAGTIAGASSEANAAERLVNLAARSITAPGAPLITGFVIGGTSPKQVLIRAAGPALLGQPFNVANALNNPAIQLFRGSTELAQNDNWATPVANRDVVSAASLRAGAFAFRANSGDAAIVRTLAPGAYTVSVTGGTGVVLAEIYEVLEAGETPAARRLLNVSARGVVAPTSPLIAGFVVGGSAPQRVLIRGIGPALARAPFNVAGALANPQLTLYRGGTAVKTNEAWSRDADAALIRSAAATVGAFALDAQSLDAAMLIYLEPGAYTAQVTGVGNAAADTGIALVEVYEVP